MKIFVRRCVHDIEGHLWSVSWGYGRKSRWPIMCFGGSDILEVITFDSFIIGNFENLTRKKVCTVRSGKWNPFEKELKEGTLASKKTFWGRGAFELKTEDPIHKKVSVSILLGGNVFLDNVTNVNNFALPGNWQDNANSSTLYWDLLRKLPVLKLRTFPLAPFFVWC